VRDRPRNCTPSRSRLRVSDDHPTALRGIRSEA
jgi:hypothetical protein